jgi:hypothetical protein
MAVAAGSGATCVRGAAQDVSAIKVIMHANILFIFPLSLVQIWLPNGLRCYGRVGGRWNIYLSLISRDATHVKTMPNMMAKRNEVSQSMVLAP